MLDPLQTIERRIAQILQEAYIQDASVRHDPLFQDLDRLHQDIRQVVDQAEDDANQEALEKWARINK